MINVSLLNIIDDNNKIKYIDSLNPSYIHVDVMDAKFVKNKMDMLNLPILNSKIDVHLMVYDIKEYIDLYKQYNPQFITFHYEATDDVIGTINYIHSLGIKAGLAIKPNTRVEEITEYLNLIDLVLVMSVEPGAGGQKFIDESEDKINYFYELRKQNNYQYLIEVDGGVNFDSKIKCRNADMLVVGSYITTSDNPKERYESML